MKPTTIRSLPFRREAHPHLGVELFRLSELFERAARPGGGLDHALDAPQRPEFHTIYVGLRGRGRLVVDFTPVPLGADTLTIVARGRVQQFVTGAAARGVDAWMILVRPEQLGAAADDPLRSPAVLSPAWSEPALALPAAAHQTLLAVVDQLAAEQARPPDTLQPAILDNLVRVIVLHAERALAGRADPLPPALARFFTILERDHARTRSVGHYARAAGVSARRLGELLVERTGKSTKQVVDERVVLECKRLLVHTEISVKELAARLAFDEPTNLVKFFRLHTGTTPLGFRERQRRMFSPSGRGS